MPKISPRYAQYSSKYAQICSKYAQNMLNICPRYAQYVAKLCSIHTRNVNQRYDQISPRYAQDMPKIWSKYAQYMNQLQMFQNAGYGGGPIFKVVQSVKKGVLNRAVDTLRRQGVKRRKGA